MNALPVNIEKRIKRHKPLDSHTVAGIMLDLSSKRQQEEVYSAVIAWMDANGFEPAEPMFNIYHVSPHETQNPDEFVTEICYPVKRRG